jgi:membrane fusion protein
MDGVMEGLFRDEAVKAHQPQWLGTTRLALPVTHQVWGGVAALTIIALLGWLFLGHYTRRKHVAGRLVPTTGLIRITTRAAGTVAGLRVTEGAQVSAGQVLLAVTGDRSSQDMGNTDAVVAARLHDQQAQLRATLKGLKRESTMQATGLRQHMASLVSRIGQLDEQIRLQRHHVAMASDLVHKAAPLHQRGIVSSVEFDQYKADALTQKSGLKSLRQQRLDLAQQRQALRVQLTRLPLDTAVQTHKLRGQLAQLDASLAKNAVDQTMVLRAPVSGVVSAVLVETGQAVQPGQALVAVMPHGASLRAQLLVPSGAIGFVHQGTPVVLHYQAFPYQKFGAQHGKVVAVSRSALTSAEASELLGQQAPPQPLYRVKVKLARQNIEAYGKPQALLPGMTVDADLLLDRRRMIEWIFEPLYGMARKDGGHA